MREVRHRSSGRPCETVQYTRDCCATDGGTLSLHCSPKKGGLYVDKADARVVHRRRPSCGYYDVPYYGALAYPRLIASTPYYNIAPYGGITPYGVVPYPQHQ